jgi:hypothetical protein
MELLLQLQAHQLLEAVVEVELKVHQAVFLVVLEEEVMVVTVLLSGTSGTANTGGGAGGNGASGSGTTSGGSGVVILRMADADYSGTTTGSPTVTTSVGGTDTVLVFTGSGSYTG